MILQKIVATKIAEIGFIAENNLVSKWEKALADLPPTRDFKAALTPKPAIVAEIKCASPSRGRLTADFRPAQIAQSYVTGGAAALSVLTDKDFFAGHPSHLEEARAATLLPILRKDFILAESQVLESRVMGADAVLLIASLLDERKMTALINYSHRLGLTPLVEIHDETELAKAVDAGAQVIGINNRNLRTFQTDITTTLKLAPLIPKGLTVVSESGITTRKHIELLAGAGVKAFLIGEALIAASDREAKLKELLGKGNSA